VQIHTIDTGIEGFGSGIEEVLPESGSNVWLWQVASVIVLLLWRME